MAHPSVRIRPHHYRRRPCRRRVLHIVARIQEWLESLLAGPGVRRRGKEYRLTFETTPSNYRRFGMLYRPQTKRGYPFRPASWPTSSDLAAAIVSSSGCPPVAARPAKRISGGIRVLRLWERNRGTAVWNRRVPTCRSTPGFLSYPPTFRSELLREKFLFLLFLSRPFFRISLILSVRSSFISCYVPLNYTGRCQREDT